MSRMPVLSGKKLLRILLKQDYVVLRRKGSHVFIESMNGLRGTVVPLHGNEDLGIGLLKSILNDLDLSTEDLRKMMYGK